MQKSWQQERKTQVNSTKDEDTTTGRDKEDQSLRGTTKIDTCDTSDQNKEQIGTLKVIYDLQG